jgi:hypothetical protein
MTRPLAAAAIATCAFVAGCGGGAKKQAVLTVQSSTSDCDFKQITAGARREGVCVARGVTVTVVNRAHLLHGKDYDVRVLGVRTATALRTRSGRPLPAHGRFVVVRLRVKNTLAAPHDFDRRSDLVFLFVDKRYFSESRRAEGDPALQPFALRKTDLQPDEQATGTVVFDVPLQHARDLTATGSNLIFVSFADEAKGFPTGSEPLQTLGYVRLWK